MRLMQNTTTLDDATVKEALEFVAPPGVSGDVMLRKTSGTLAGYAYWKGSSYHASARPFVTLRVGDGFPRGPRPPVGPGYLPTPALGSRVEALVYLAAHELRHLWQARVPRGRRVWGARGQFSERDADAYAIRMLRKWRREH